MPSTRPGHPPSGNVPRNPGSKINFTRISDVFLQGSLANNVNLGGTADLFGLFPLFERTHYVRSGLILHVHSRNRSILIGLVYGVFH